MASEPDELETAAWTDIDQEFSRPVTRSDDMADYVPTQILTELFKSKGMDGIRYKSALGDGGNFALFDLQDAEIQSCRLFKIQRIRFDFTECGNPWRAEKR